LLVHLASREDIESAHDCAEGGLAVALAECCFDAGGIGVDVTLPLIEPAEGGDGLTATLFGESASRVVVSADPAHTPAIISAAGAAGVSVRRLGRTGGGMIRIAVEREVVIEMPLNEAEARWVGALRSWLDGRAA
jgi:phosphoribosylformylglycinamidine synthase